MVNIAKLDPLEQKVLDDIRDHGCQVMHVFDPDSAYPNFSYSIGFPASVQQPEVIVFGRKRELMHSMVNEVRRQCAEDDLILADGLRIDGLIEDFDCVAREVTDPEALREHFGWAIWYHRSRRGESLTKAFQLVWPGAVQGLFPWEPGCVDEVIEMQPALYARGTVH